MSIKRQKRATFPTRFLRFLFLGCHLTSVLFCFFYSFFWGSLVNTIRKYMIAEVAVLVEEEDDDAFK